MNESRGVHSNDPMFSSNDGANNEEIKRIREDNFFHGLLRRLPVKEAAEEIRLIGKIALPVFMTTLLIHSKSVISMLLLGRMGKIELAGGALAIAFANVTGYSVMKGLSMGMDPICCQAYGAKRWSVITQTYLKTFLLLLFASIPISLLWLNSQHVFLRFGQDPVITKVAKGYLVFSIPELLAHAHLNPLRSFLRTQSLNSAATIVATISTILHLPINYFLLKYLNLGVKGIALGSVWYAFNMNIGLSIYVALSKKAMKPWVGVTIISTLQGWGPLLSLSLPSVFSVCLEWWWYELVLFLSGLLSNPQSCVAATGIMIQTTSLMYVFPYALSLSISQRVGHELGAGQPDRAQWAGTIGLIVGVTYGFAALGWTTAVRQVWGKMYSDDPQILEMVSLALPIVGLAELGNAPQTAVCGVLTGSARPKVGVRVNIAAFYLIGLPVAVLLGFTWKIGYRGLWFGLLASQCACLGMMVWTLIQTDWKYQAKRAEELTLAVLEKDDVETNLVPAAN